MFSSNATQVSSANYIEDVFSTYLYTGNASTQTITNGIDLAGKGGLVWIKNRSLGGINHALQDTVRGPSNILFSNDTVANQAYSTSITAFNSTGFALGAENLTNQSAQSFVSWTFRKQPKFFDVVTYTGTGSDPLTLSHNLQSVPGCIIIKCTSTATNWRVHSTALDMTLTLNTTNAGFTPDGLIKNLTSSTFQVNNSADVNSSGQTYVAYLFAHDAGGFGLTGTDNVISCGSFTTDGGGVATVSLGYEPQWVMVKTTSSSDNWQIYDTMRGLVVDTATPNRALYPNTSGAEASLPGIGIKATGFSTELTFNTTYIYIAIRRGPMKVPTSGTSVFAPVAFTGTNTTTVINAGFPMDMVWIQARNTNAVLGGGAYDLDRLRGNVNRLFIPSTGAESASLGSPYDTFDNMTGLGADGTFFNNSAINYSDWFFRRAPSFFDEVCYTGTGVARTLSHNLGAVPELIIVKRRDTTGAWDSYSSALANTEYVVLNTTAAKATGTTRWNSTTPTSSVFSVGTSTTTNASAGTYVAYLFATCAGVSKVGSYTGTGTTKQVDCGFTGGARFVLIKRTDSTGDWYVWDSARGIVAGNDPYLLLNSTAAEVTSTDYVDTYSAGFEISSTAPAAINANGGTFIFLAIA